MLTYRFHAAGLVVAAGLAVSSVASAQPAGDAKPAATPPAAAPAANVNPEAKAVLQASIAALQKLQSIEYHAHRFMTGNLPVEIDFDGDVKLIRAASDKNRCPMTIKGKSKGMGGKDDLFWYMLDGMGNMTAVDQENKQMHAGPFQPGIKAFNQRSQGDQLLLDIFFQQEPYKGLDSHTLTLEPDADVHGEKCKVVKSTRKLAQGGGGTSWTMWHISAKDNIPRRMEQGTDMGNSPIVVKVELSNVKANTGLNLGSLDIKAPEGFDVIKHEGPTPTPPPQDQNPQAQAPVQAVPAPVLGIASGAAAPGFALKGMDGNSVKLEDLKGNVTVLAFLWPLNTPSKKAGAVLADVQKAFEGKKVKVLAMACRAKSDDDAKKFHDESLAGVPMLLGADDIAKTYEVKGYPSFYVIDADGKIVEFFQTSDVAALKDKLSAAVQKGLDGKK